MVVVPQRRLSLLLTLVAAAADAQPAGTSVSVRLNSVMISKIGVLEHHVSGNETPATCSRFRLTTADAREFFAKATPVSAELYGHRLDASNCVSTGKAVTTAGVDGRWTIDLERRGELVLNNGQRRYYYCARCSARQYDEVDADALPQ